MGRGEDSLTFEMPSDPLFYLYLFYPFGWLIRDPLWKNKAAEHVK